MVRLFVAIDLPDEVRDQYFFLQPSLKQSRARLSLVSRNSLHITLKFIGEVEGSRMDRISEALSTIRMDPFRIIPGLITTNSQHNPRVIWSDLDDEQGYCRKLAGEIDRVLGPLGIPAEKRAYHPHITIARIKQFHPSIFEAVAGITCECSGTITVDRFILKKSELTPQGPVYTDIRVYPLGGTS